MSDPRLRSNRAPIGSIESLAHHLQVSEELLNKVAAKSSDHWRAGRRIPKKDGSIRITNSASRELKTIHRKINQTILSKVTYPPYLFGSLPKDLRFGSRDHVANAKLHAGSRIIVTTDIQNYFPSVTENVIHSIWQGFFNFSPDVAQVLTQLTAYKGSLPQGWACSSYLAQLVFWREEPDTVRWLRNRGVRYSRLTDDITLSFDRTMTDAEITQLFAKILKMLGHKGTSIHRGKTQVTSRALRQSVNNVNVALSGVTLPQDYRKKVRARVHRLVTQPESFGTALDKELQSVRGQISYLARFHPTDAKALRRKLTSVNEN